MTLRGSDVVHSGMFDHLKKISSGLSVSPRRILLRYEAPGGKEPLKLAFDKFGNYSVWVRAAGENLPITFQFLDLLDRAKLLEDEPAFPVRDLADRPLFSS